MYNYIFIEKNIINEIEKGDIVLRKIFLVLTLLWMAFIFYGTHSQYDGVENTTINVSFTVNEEAGEFDDIKEVGLLNFYDDQIENTILFLEFFVLGIFVFLTVYTGKFVALVNFILITTLYSLSDEVHRMYLLKGNFNPNTYIISFAGALTALLLLYGTYAVISKLDVAKTKVLLYPDFVQGFDFKETTNDEVSKVDSIFEKINNNEELSDEEIEEYLSDN